MRYHYYSLIVNLFARISALQSKKLRPDLPISEQLDMKCLQILRAMVHNEERRLPEDWALRLSEAKIRKLVRKC